MSDTLKLKEVARTYQHRDFNEDLNVFYIHSGLRK